MRPWSRWFWPPWQVGTSDPSHLRGPVLDYLIAEQRGTCRAGRLTGGAGGRAQAGGVAVSWRRWGTVLVKFLALTADEETPLEKDEAEELPAGKGIAAQIQGTEKKSPSPKCYDCGSRPLWPRPGGPSGGWTRLSDNRWYCHQCGPPQGEVPLHQLPPHKWWMVLRAGLANPPREVRDWVRHRRRVDNIGGPGFNIDLPAYQCRLCGGWHKALPDDPPPCRPIP